MSPDEEPLALLDPEPEPVVVTSDDPMLADILAGDRRAPVAKNVLPGRHVISVGWVAGCTVAAVGVAGVMVFSLASPAATPPAFADWTPEPNPNVTAAQKQQVYDSCASIIQDRVVVNEFGQSVSSRGATAVIVDERGSYHAMLVGSNTMWGFCSNLTGDGSLTGTIEQNYTDPNWTVPADDIALISSASGQVFGDAGAPFFESAIGRAGANVVKVQVVTNSGLTVDASLSDGFWMVYGPVDWNAMMFSQSNPGEGFARYIITLKDGTTTTLPVTADGGLVSPCWNQSTPVPGLACAPENAAVQTAPPYGLGSDSGSPGAIDTGSAAATPPEPIEFITDSPATPWPSDSVQTCFISRPSADYALTCFNIHHDCTASSVVNGVQSYTCPSGSNEIWMMPATPVSGYSEVVWNTLISNGGVPDMQCNISSPDKLICLVPDDSKTP